MQIWNRHIFKEEKKGALITPVGRESSTGCRIRRAMVLSRDGQRALSLQDCTLTPVEEKDVDLLAGGRELRFCSFYLPDVWVGWILANWSWEKKKNLRWESAAVDLGELPPSGWLAEWVGYFFFFFLIYTSNKDMTP